MHHTYIYIMMSSWVMIVFPISGSYWHGVGRGELAKGETQYYDVRTQDKFYYMLQNGRTEVKVVSSIFSRKMAPMILM